MDGPDGFIKSGPLRLKDRDARDIRRRVLDFAAGLWTILAGLAHCDAGWNGRAIKPISFQPFLQSRAANAKLTQQPFVVKQAMAASSRVSKV